MDETTPGPGDQDADDFGHLLGRRLRSYRGGILGDLGSMNARTASTGGEIVSRSADFTGSLQSLLSYRQVVIAGEQPSSVIPPSSEPDTPPAAINRLADDLPEPEPDEPAAPAAFGSPEWLAAMSERMQKVEQASIPSGPSGAVIEAALSGPDFAPAARPSGRRSSVQEISGPVTLPSASEGAPAQRLATDPEPAVSDASRSGDGASGAPGDGRPVQRETPARNESPDTESAQPAASQPRQGPPIRQRRTRPANSQPPDSPAPRISRQIDSAPEMQETSVSSATPPEPESNLATRAGNARPEAGANVPPAPARSSPASTVRRLVAVTPPAPATVAS